MARPPTSGKAGITGYFASPPFSDVLKKSDKVHAVLSSKEFLDGNEATIALLACKKDFVDANPTVAKLLIASIEEAIAFINRHPSTAADIYIKPETAKISKEDLLDSLTSGGIIYSVAPSGLMKFATFMTSPARSRVLQHGGRMCFFPISTIATAIDEGEFLSGA